MKEVKAMHKYAKISPFKVRLIANQIRNKPVEEALNILSFSNKKAAILVKQVLSSAISNAEHNDGLDIDELKVRDAYTLFLGAVASTAAQHHENAIALLELSKLKNKNLYESRFALALLYLEIKNMREQ